MLDRLLAALTAPFGIVAVVPALIGLYGVVSFAFAARTHEIGIRLALGASRTRVLLQVMQESAALLLLGIAIGLPVTFWASRLPRSLLYDLSATDALMYATSSSLLALVALTATWVPARAAFVDPLLGLNHE